MQRANSLVANVDAPRRRTPLGRLNAIQRRYALVRTWHIQSALFWIATGFLAVGLFLAPLINGGKDPRYQKLGVDILFWAL